MKVNLDTNVFLAVKNKEPEYEICEKIIDSVEDKTINGVMSVIVLEGVLVGFYQNDENEGANQFSNNTLLNYEIIPVEQNIAQKAAQLRAHYNIKLPDAIISVSTIRSGADIFISRDKTLQKKLNIKVATPKEFVEKFLVEDSELKKHG